MCRRRQQQVCERNLVSHDAHNDQIGKNNSIFIENDLANLTQNESLNDLPPPYEEVVDDADNV